MHLGYIQRDTYMNVNMWKDDLKKKFEQTHWYTQERDHINVNIVEKI